MSHLEVCAVWVVAGLHVSPQHPALVVAVKSLPVNIVDTRRQRLPVIDPYIVLVTGLHYCPGDCSDDIICLGSA